MSQSSPFLDSLIRFLMPFFIGTAVDIDAARADILETLNSYGARTRAEMLSAARIIALGMATLDMLSDSNAAELSPALKIRHRNCANALNRATAQAEKTLDQSLAREIPAQSGSEPVADVTDAETQATIDHAIATIQAHRKNRPTTAQPDRNQQLWAGAMRDTLKNMGLANPPG